MNAASLGRSTRAAASLLMTTWRESRRLNLRRMSAALSFYLLISFAPLTVVSIVMAGLVLGPQRAVTGFMRQAEQLLGAERAAGVAEMIAAAADPSATLSATLIGIAVLLWGGSRLFYTFEHDLDEIWAPEKRERKRGWRGVLAWLRRRLGAMLVVLAAGLIFVSALVSITLLNAFGSQIERLLPGYVHPSALAHAGWLLTTLSLSLTLAYRSLPKASVRWRSALLGGLSAGSLLTLAMLLVSWALARAGRYALLTAVVTPFLGLGGLYLVALLVYLGALLARVWQERA